MKRLIIGTAIFAMIFGNAFSVKAQATFVKHTIAAIGQPSDVCSCDVNRDGLQDLATVSATGGEVAWWQNDGSHSFTRHTVRTGFNGCRSVRAGDMDHDADIDLVAASWSGNKIEWYENNGSESFTVHILDGNFKGAHTVQLVDLDQDDDLDVLCSGWDHSPAVSEVAWWKNMGDRLFEKQVISSTLDQSPFVDAADMDGDGDLDLVGADETSGEVYWWRNNGNETFEEFLIDNQFTLAHTVLARDIDKDGDPDILGAACTSGLQAWYENMGPGVFEKHKMENLSGAIWLDTGDFDLDGDMDLISTGMGASQLALYTQSGRKQFSRSWLEGGLASGFALNIVDLDNDQDPDIVAIGYNSNYLGWWENVTNRISLIKSPAWICPGISDGSLLVVNNESGNVIKMKGLDPVCGIMNIGFCQEIVCSGGMLYAASGSEVVVMHPESGVRQTSYRTDAQYLEGIAADSSGCIYVSAPFDSKILKINTITGQISEFSSELIHPKALKFDTYTSSILILDGEENVSIKTFDVFTGEIVSRKTTLVQAGGDIEPDGEGNYYLSSPWENAVYIVTDNWQGEIRLWKSGLGGPWGLYYHKDRKELIASMNSENKLAIIPSMISVTFGLIPPPDNDMRIYPNPFHDFVSFTIPGSCHSGSLIELTDMAGRIVFSKWIEPDCPELNGNLYVLDLSGVPLVQSSLYFFTWSGMRQSKSAGLIHTK